MGILLTWPAGIDSAVISARFAGIPTEQKFIKYNAGYTYDDYR